MSESITDEVLFLVGFGVEPNNSIDPEFIENR